MELIRWRLAERFGWTLAEVDAISIKDLTELGQVDHGIMTARENEKQSQENFKRMGMK